MKTTQLEKNALKSGARLARQAGVLSIEMIIVLGIVALILLGVAGRVAVSFLSNDNTAELSNITAIYTAIKDTKTTVGYGAAGTDLSAVVVAGGKLPSNIAVNGNAISNQFGGTYTLTSTGQGFTIADPSIPQKNCLKIVAGATQGGQYATTVVNSGTSYSGPMSAAQAQTACNSATNSVTLTSTY
ncbi:type 4 pilus major pilin [Paraburkholderia sacchari]|uniref:Pilus assembly protein PilX n=1 Tax=Paraburkholderia sacchari TaxID=159450 RepID=A0A8T6ZL30_9BURK|nr:type 4 pilus major pilin [Paraburkholderia sacchari]NLP65486.1 pilus assembly protein PilX [Paraburkholderia sacchari]NLP65571.1 pilus assembly protein PilX [Paraburkholderia sacchari]